VEGSEVKGSEGKRKECKVSYVARDDRVRLKEWSEVNWSGEK
jgi:hypothetical protein